VTALELRSYQVEAVAAVEAAWSRGVKRPALVAATGAGKTVMFAHLAARFLEFVPDKRVLVLAHRDELLDQGARKLNDVAPDLRVGKVAAETNVAYATDVVVGSVQTLRIPKRREALTADSRDIGLIITDECHHATSASYRAIYDAFPKALHLGVTATMVRADKARLGDVWDEIVAEIGILKLIKQGFLSDIRAIRVEVADLDLADVRTRGGDFVDSQLGDAMELSSAPEMVAKAFVEHAGDRSAILFAPTVATAELFAHHLNEAGVVTEVLTGTTPKHDRRAMLARYTAGTTQVISNVAVLTEGTDLPRTSCIVMARPTKSAGLFIQCLDEQTEILSDCGWLGIDDDWTGARPAAFDPADGSVHWSDLLGRVDRPLLPGESMFGISSPTMDIRVTGGHRMVWAGRERRDGAHAWRVSEAADLARRRTTYSIPIAGRQKAPGVPLTDAELRFIGWVMTDGCVNKSTGSVQISQATHQSWFSEVEKCLKECGFKYALRFNSDDTNYGPRKSPLAIFTISKGAPRGTDKHLRGWGELEPWLSKDLAPALQDVTREQLAVLLEAMHLGNGTKQANSEWVRRSYHIGTPSLLMAERLQSLCVRRGFKANIATQINPSGKPYYILHVKDAAWKSMGGAGQRDRESLAEVPTRLGERVWCIEVDTGAILTRRGGKVAVVGNCAGRALRPYPGKEYALLLDVAGATETNSLCSLSTLAGRPVKDEQSLIEAEADELAEAERLEREQEARGGLELAPQWRPAALAHREVDLFAGSAWRWRKTKGGIDYISTGTRYWFLMPGEAGDGWDVGWLAAKGYVEGQRGGALREGVSELGTAMSWAEQAANRDDGADVIGAKGRPWHKRKASDKQLSFARALGIEVAEGAKALDVSDAIDHVTASRVIDTRILPFLRESGRLVDEAVVA